MFYNGTMSSVAALFLRVSRLRIRVENFDAAVAAQLQGFFKIAMFSIRDGRTGFLCCGAGAVSFWLSLSRKAMRLQLRHEDSCYVTDKYETIGNFGNDFELNSLQFYFYHLHLYNVNHSF
jgi:hypothetical protein